MRKVNIYKTFKIWFLFIPIAILNGVIREYIYPRSWEELYSHQFSTVALIVMFFMYLFVFYNKFLASLTNTKILPISLLLVFLTISFEFTFGRFVGGKSWNVLFMDYNILIGRIWSLFILSTLLFPSLIKFIFKNDKILPPSYMLYTLILQIFLCFTFQRDFKLGFFFYLGILTILFGIFINIWTDTLFKKVLTTVKPLEMPSSLITSGPFKITKHPMYLGMFSIILGTGLIINPVVSPFMPLIFYIIIYKKFIIIEEQNMKQQFGEEYNDFKSLSDFL